MSDLGPAVEAPGLGAPPGLEAEGTAERPEASSSRKTAREVEARHVSERSEACG